MRLRFHLFNVLSALWIPNQACFITRPRFKKSSGKYVARIRASLFILISRRDLDCRSEQGNRFAGIRRGKLFARDAEVVRFLARRSELESIRPVWVRAHAIRSLKNKLWAEACFRSHPIILEKISVPIIIIVIKRLSLVLAKHPLPARLMSSLVLA